MRISRFVTASALAWIVLASQRVYATSYTLSPAAPPTANWTDTSGAVWTPSGGYPGSGANDTASCGSTASTITVDSTIPNAIDTLTWNCAGSAIDVATNGQLAVAVSGLVDNGAEIRVTGGTFIDNAPMPVGMKFDNAARLHLTAGTIQGSGTLYFEPGTFFDWDSANAVTVDGLEIENEGAVTFAPSSTASITFASGVQFFNEPGGTITLDAALDSILSSGTNGIKNRGLLQMNGGTFVHLQPQLDNVSGGTGVVINNGFLLLEGGGNGDAPFTINAPGYLEFPVGTYTMTPNGVVSGSGTLKVNGGTLSIGGVTEPANFMMVSGTLTGDGFLSIANNFTWTGGTIEGFGGAQIAGTGHGDFNGADGLMLLRQRTFNVYGTADYGSTTNTLQLADSATLGVYGTFNVLNDADITCNCATAVQILISPNGTFTKGGGSTGLSVISPPLNNNSTVSVNDGTLELAGGGIHNGVFFGGSATTLAFSSAATFIPGYVFYDGTVSFPSSSTSITGTYQAHATSITGASVEITNSATTTDFAMTSGDLTVGDFAMSGTGSWSGGTIEGTAFHVTSGATLTIDAANENAYLTNATLTNDGTIDYTAAVPGNHLELFSGIIVNEANALFDLQADAPIKVGVVVIGDLQGQPKPGVLSVFPNSFNNAGTLQKSGGTGTTEFDPDLHNDGSILAQSGIFSPNNVFDQAMGTISLEGGDIEAALLTMNGGSLIGSGTFDGSVQNDAGIVAPGTASSIGAIAITDAYTQNTSGQLQVKLGGPAAGQFDAVNVTNTATLDGTFTATLYNGYEPADSTTFDVLTYASHSAAFATENLPTWQPPHGSMTSSYLPTAFRLTAVVTPSSADLTITKNGPATANADSTLNYTVSVFNYGPDAVSGTITVVDTLPAGVTGASGSGASWSCGAPAGGTITCTTPGPLAASGTIGGLTFTMTAPPNGGSITNSATVSSAANDTDSTNNTSLVTTTIVSVADLSIVKNGPAGVTSGQNVVYTITVTNNGPSTANSVIVSDPLPANLTFVSNSGACTSNFPCSLGAMTAGQVATITATYSTSSSFSGNVTNTATVSSTTNDPNNTNDTSSKTTNVGAQADLSIVKTGTASASPGQNVTYTVVVTNNGPSPATGVVISDPTPVGIAFQSNSGACATPYPCSIGTLNAGQSATITSTYTIPPGYSGASVVNTATASSAVNDPDGSNDASMFTTTIVAQADLSIAKSGPASVAPGQLIQYTITVTNLGPTSAGSVTVSDTTPPGLVFVANTGACATPFPCNLGTLASGQSAAITASYNVPPGYASGSITNAASVNSVTASDPNTSNNSSSVTTPVVAQSDLAIVKTGPAFFDANQDVVYTITVTNNGPLIANNVFVTDPTPANTTFVSNTGSCTGPFPCGLGTMTVGQTATITTTFHVDPSFPGTSLANTASVSSSTLDVNGTNDSSTAITPRVSGALADLAIVKTGPNFAAPNDFVDFTITVTNNGPMTATSIVINDLTPAGTTFISSAGACASYPCMLPSLAPNASVVMYPRYLVQATSGTITNTASVSSAASDPQSGNDTSSATVQIAAATACPATAPQLLAPANHAKVGSPVTLSWSAVANATHYVVVAGATTNDTTSTSITIPLPAGDYDWTVTALGDSSCPQQISATSSFTVCGDAIATPVASAVAETTTGQTYTISWKPVTGTATYELQESADEAFAAPQTTQMTGTSKTFTKSVAVATPFFYRVRAISDCGATSAYSHVIRVAVVLVPPPTSSTHNVNVPDGSTTPVTFQVFVPGLPNGSTTFVATVDKPWLSVTPTSGIVTPQGINLTISADPTTLPNGTWMGTVLVVYGTVVVARGVAANDVPPPPSTYSVPVSLSLVTPITPTDPNTPADSALIIPAVGHLAGLDSNWRSDIRIANTAGGLQNYRLTFTAGGGDALVQSTIIGVDAGNTTALDDIVRNWYGEGSLGESSNGALVIEPMESDDKVSVVPSTTTAVSSRTFNASSQGTLGQFIPAIPFRRFIAHAGGASLLSLQQIAQNSAYRTNFGILEAGGKPASVLVRVLDEFGIQLLDQTFSLRAGEQRQLNAFLRQNGIETSNGRVEVSVTDGDGKVTAYASVVDNQTQDPFLVFGVPVGSIDANRFVIPGVADLAGSSASWRSDVRIFNSGLTPQLATLTFFPAGDPAHSTTREATIQPGEVRALDSVLRSTFGLENAGGALHVTTADNAPLIVTARTYDDGPDGTVGQFVPAVTPQEAVGAGERSLEILQTEESVRFRTNFGLAEVSGKPAVVEISVHLPDSKATPVVQLELQGNEFRQLPVLGSLGLVALYNTRVSVRVISGEGRVTAYGSVIDNLTGDPTFIPPQ